MSYSERTGASEEQSHGIRAQRGYERRDPQIVWAKVDPRLDRVRDDPRIQAVIRNVGL